MLYQHFSNALMLNQCTVSVWIIWLYSILKLVLLCSKKWTILMIMLNFTKKMNKYYMDKLGKKPCMTRTAKKPS